MTGWRRHAALVASCLDSPDGRAVRRGGRGASLRRCACQDRPWRRGYDPVVGTQDVLALDGGTPLRTDPLDFSKGAALLGPEEADAVAAVIAGRSLFRYKDTLIAGA